MIRPVILILIVILGVIGLSSLFVELARQTDKGVPLETAMSNIGRQFPPHVRGLILASTQSGRLAEVLGEYAALQRERSNLS